VLSERLVNVMTGLISLLFLLGVTVFGLKVASGAFDDVYQVEGLFSAAGQGLIKDSDVKIHGVNIGKVSSVRFRDGQALVRMSINSGERIPAGAKATIRPKTLFGEKFVDIDPGDRENDGPFLADEGRIKETLGGFELEQVLSDAYPILQAIDPEELSVVLGTLADASDGTADEINRQLANWAEVTAVNVAHDADTRQFLDDLALLSGELAARADDVVGAARELNVALPELNRREDQLTGVLESASQLAADVADVLEANRPLLHKLVTQGGKSLQIIFDERRQLPGFVTGLRKAFQLLAEASSHPDLRLPDGTQVVAVKFVFPGGPPCGREPRACPEPSSNSASRPAGRTATGPAMLLPLPPLGLPVPTVGVDAVTGLLRDLLG
jgi:phospholipid/cholesterol/gamma-HCH transport system substrate-binding protein